MNHEDGKILNARFTLLHSAIEELSRFRRNEYDLLLSRVELLEAKMSEAVTSAQYHGSIYGLLGGIASIAFYLLFSYLGRD